MTHPKPRLLTPIAAALTIALATGSAAAANPYNMNQQSTNNQDQQSSDNMNMKSSENMDMKASDNMDMKASDHMNMKSWDDMNQQSRDAYREGQIWATYVVNPVLQSYKIDNDVQGSKVTLTGTVDTKYDKWLAEHIATHAKGITTVANEIKVDPTHVVVTTFVPANAFAQQVRNATTSAEINSQLLWSEYTDGLDIKVAVRDGKATLTGVADTAKAKQRAGEIAADTRGVKSVDNKLTVSGKPVAQSMDMVNDDWIGDRVRASYRFNAGMDHGDIDVDVSDGTVTLAGTVDSDFERQRAIGIAQHILGVKAVKADGLRVAHDQVATN